MFNGSLPVEERVVVTRDQPPIRIIRVGEQDLQRFIDPQDVAGSLNQVR